MGHAQEALPQNQRRQGVPGPSRTLEPIGLGVS